MTSSASKWKVGQEVTVHFPYANQGSERCRDTTISKIGRKYVKVDGIQATFDDSWEVPRGNQADLYTRSGYIEMLYIKKVLQTFDLYKSSAMPIALMLQIGDYLGVKRPDHLRDDIDPKMLKAGKDTKPKT